MTDGRVKEKKKNIGRTNKNTMNDAKREREIEKTFFLLIFISIFGCYIFIIHTDLHDQNHNAIQNLANIMSMWLRLRSISFSLLMCGMGTLAEQPHNVYTFFGRSKMMYT